MRLGIDTTNNNLCFALFNNNHSVFFENNYPCSNVAEILAPKIQDMLVKFSITSNDITEIISVTGPGGFSGVRIGTAFITGFTNGSTIKIIGLSSLEAASLSVQNPQEKTIIVACLNARREGVYIAIFDNQYQRLTSDSIVNIQDLPVFLSEFQTQSYYLSGHGSEIVKPFLDANLLLNSLEYPLAQEFTAKADMIIQPHDNCPIYLREPDAKLPQKT